MSVITNRDADHIKAHADIESEEKRSPDAPRVRQLDVTDRHVLYLLTLVADDLLSTRRLGMSALPAALEMQAALNAMVTS